MKILIVGGVAGGATAAARLRRLNETAEIILFERGEYISFANCGLPYYIGGEITDKAALTVMTPESFTARFDVDIRTQSEVVTISRDQKCVEIRDLKTGKSYTETYDKLILSPGASPIKPNIEGIESDRVFTLRNIPDTYRIKNYIDQQKPRSALVVGGGYIGVEMAENLRMAGLEVTIVEFADHVIAPLDYDMAADVHNHLRQKGVSLILGDGVTGIREEGDALRVLLGKGEVLCDMVILSVGVRPENSLAINADLPINARGAMIVDEHMQTIDPDIYAVGDAVEIVDFITKDAGYIPLAGPANKQARIAADHINGIDSKYKGTQGTGILKCFDLTIGTTGMTEARAKQLNLDYEKSYTYSGSHASYYPGAVSMSIKLVFEKDGGKILGAQIVGYEGVDKRMDVIATAIRAGMTIYDLTELELAYAPPFSSAKDPVNIAGFAAENLLTGKVRAFQWDQVADLPRDGSVNLIDSRPAVAYDLGHIDGFINIPEASIRSSLDKIDASKPVYIVCQMGLTGYTVSRMLSQRGYDCYNLAGGYRLWHSIFHGTPNPVPNAEPTVSSAAVISPAAATKEFIKLNACGLQCPGPIMKVSEALAQATDGDLFEVQSSDPAFGLDIKAWCGRTNNTFLSMTSEKGITTVTLRKGCPDQCTVPAPAGVGDNKNLIVFSGDLDKAIASFIIANASAAMGRKVSMFFTFWGLNVLRRPEKVSVPKDLMSRMFGMMMPRGSQKLGLSNMNMGGMGALMIRNVMKKKNIASLEELIQSALDNGVELIACSMSMDVMGIKAEELIDGVQLGGAAAMLANAEESDMSLFI